MSRYRKQKRSKKSKPKRSQIPSKPLKASISDGVLLSKDLRDLEIKKLNHKYPGIVESLGKVTDTTLASRYNVATSTVCIMRNRLGIPTYQERQKLLQKEQIAADRKVSAFRIKLGNEYPDILKMLGWYTDSYIAEKYKVDGRTVGRWRAKLGIPTYQDTVEKHSSKKAEKFYWSDNKLGDLWGIPLSEALYQNVKKRPALIAWLGVESDEVLAERHGIHVRAVTGFREELGIALGEDY